MKDLIWQIENYIPFNEQEEKDRKQMLSLLLKEDNIFYRENQLCHMTASAWVVNKERTKVLMAYHNIYQSWSWLGGHADGDTNLLQVALKEAKEESGLKNVEPVTDAIYSLEILTVDGHEKKGSYVSSHLHLNVTYLLEADENQPLTICANENSQVSWFSLNEAILQSSEPWFQTRVYPKLIKKINFINYK